MDLIICRKWPSACVSPSIEQSSVYRTGYQTWEGTLFSSSCLQLTVRQNLLLNINYLLSLTGICSYDHIYDVSAQKPSAGDWVSSSINQARNLAVTLITVGKAIFYKIYFGASKLTTFSGGDSFGVGFIIAWISLLFKFNGLTILLFHLHFKA